MKKKSFSFTAKVWLYPGETASWHFVTLPKTLGQEIKKSFGSLAKGFGSLPVAVTIGKTIWNTSIFPDSRAGTYILPLKAKVRNVEDIFIEDEVDVKIKII